MGVGTPAAETLALEAVPPLAPVRTWPGFTPTQTLPVEGEGFRRAP
jgi:hypothetical protein